MYTISRNIFSALFILMMGCTVSYAQNSKPPISIGVQVGTFVYLGDLVPSFAGSFRTAKPMITVLLNKPISNNFSLRGSFSRGNISADESVYANPSWRKDRAFSFSSPVTEISTVLVFDFNDMTMDNGGRFSPYVFTGAALSFFNIHRDWSKINLAAFNPKSSTITGLGMDTLHKTPTVVPVIPVGLGLKYTINNRLSVNTELNYRISFSDYLDGFSKSADPVAKDAYYSVSVGLNYHFLDQGIGCPHIKR